MSTMSTQTHEDLLFEIGTEELPPKSLLSLEQNLIDNVTKGLQKAELTFNKIQGFSTPRRIALIISNLANQQPIRKVVKKGPAKNAAHDEQGKPSKALLGFAASSGVKIEDLKIQQSDKGEWYIFEDIKPGETVFDLIPKILKEALDNLPLPKRMRWGDRSDSFVRPIHWIVLLYGEKIIPAEFFGCESSNQTRGHRFHHVNPILLQSPDQYDSILSTKGHVRARFQARKDFIQQGIIQAALENKTQADIEDIDLLNEVTGLTEWPVILTGQFSEDFLAVPKEALISAMKNHQKCFPLENKDHKLTSKFIIISNIESKDPKAVIRGNEAVVTARLADAAFHYELDKQTSLENRREGLKRVIFQHGLGTLWDKSERIKKISLRMTTVMCVIDNNLETNALLKKMQEELLNNANLSNQVERAALLCKADLLTQMVGEFPELQGIMGRYYALHDGEFKEVAQAIEEHYKPRFANDELPSSFLGSIIAIADRVDTMVGLFGIGKKPTGDKDPFGLRRQAIGILRLIIEKEIRALDLEYLFTLSQEIYGEMLTENPTRELIGFCFERLRAWYLEKGVPAKVFESVVARLPTKPLDFHYRINAVQEFQMLAEAESLAAANKRVQNILSKSEVPIPPEADYDEKLLLEPAEKALAEAIDAKENDIKPLIAKWQYTEALKRLAQLKDPIDRFFDTVMVMVEDERLRNNRLKLLNRLRALFLKIADISLL